MKKVFVLTGLAILTTALLLPISAQATTSLSTIGSYYDMVVDNTHGHVFVSPGGGHSTIAVMDFSGALVTTFTGGSGASGMVLSADDSTLFVALRSADEVDAFSTTTFTKTGGYPTTGASCPDTLARRGSVIWVGYGCADYNGGIGSVDPTAISPAFTTYACGCSYDPFIVIPSTNQDVLFAVDRGEDPCTIYRYNISTGSPANEISKFNPGPDGCSNLGQMTASPDGSKVYIAAGYPYEITVIKGSDLTNSATYPSNYYPKGVALSPDGTHVAAGMMGPYEQNDIDVFSIVFGEINFHYADQSTALMGVAANGLEYGADGTLFAVFGDNGSSLTFRVFLDTTKDPSSLSGSATPNPTTIGSPTTLSGSLSYPVGGTVGVHTLHVKRVNLDSSQTSLPDQTTGSSGTFSFPETSTERATGYIVSFDGDSTHTGASLTIPVVVNGPAASITVSPSRTTINYHDSITVTAHLGPTGSNRTVTIYYQPYGSNAFVLQTGTVDGAGNLSRTYAPARKTTYYATFGGDELTNPATSTSTSVAVRVLAGIAPVGPYTRSGSWTLFHYSSYCPRYKTHCPTFKGIITPNHAGQRLNFVVQHSVNGVWSNVATSYFTIPSAGYIQTYFYYSSTGIKGVPLRIRCYMSSDPDHLGNTSVWSYFQVTT